MFVLISLINQCILTIFFIFQPFDVEKEILNMLVTEGIIETNPDNIDQVKLVDFVN